MNEILEKNTTNTTAGQKTVTRPDLLEEDKCIILKQNTNTLPAEKAPAQTDQTEDWLQNLETPAAVIVTTEEI